MFSSSTLYNGLFIVNGNVLMGNNVASNSPIGYPAGSTRLIYSGDTFSNSKSQYYTGTHLQLDAQGIVGPSGKAWGGSIFLEGGRETSGGSNTHGSIQFLTGGFEAMRVASNGYVGINISTPLYTLDVKGMTNISQLLIVSTISSGSIVASGNISTSGTISASGNIVSDGILTGDIGGSNMILSGSIIAGGNITAYSDKRIKDDIITINFALDKIMKLRGVYYTRLDDINHTRRMGVIAQEIENIIPEVVLTDSSGIKSVDYGNIVGLLIEGIKEILLRL